MQYTPCDMTQGHKSKVKVTYRIQASCGTARLGSVILTTESQTRCSIIPAYMNIHKPYLIPPISMYWGRGAVALHVNIITII